MGVALPEIKSSHLEGEIETGPQWGRVRVCPLSDLGTRPGTGGMGGGKDHETETLHSPEPIDKRTRTGKTGKPRLRQE